MTAMDVPLIIQTERSHTEYPPLVILSLNRQIYLDRTDPIVFLPIVVRTSGRVYEDFPRMIFLHEHRESGILAGELPEESEQFRFL
jgi:hypothetical protein